MDWLLVDLHLNSFLSQPALLPLFSSSPAPQVLQTLCKRGGIFGQHPSGSSLRLPPACKSKLTSSEGAGEPTLLQPLLKGSPELPAETRSCGSGAGEWLEFPACSEQPVLPSVEACAGRSRGRVRCLWRPELGGWRWRWTGSQRSGEPPP